MPKMPAMRARTMSMGMPAPKRLTTQSMTAPMRLFVMNFQSSFTGSEMIFAMRQRMMMPTAKAMIISNIRFPSCFPWLWRA